jgi:putative glycerol-1-phosphate prenyltransferase
MLKKTTHTKLIVLIDPDKYNPELIVLANICKVHCFFVGGSDLKSNLFNKTIKSIKSLTKKLVIIFPGDETQISKHADGLLILSLLSGRNPDYLIGKHVISARKIIASKLKTIPVGYILVNGKKISTTQKITKTEPISTTSTLINTAIAAELLGKKMIYLEAGSGANAPIKNSIIKTIKKEINIPIIVGGGINTILKAKNILKENPDYIVIGNALEKNPDFLLDLNKLIK